MLNEQSSQVATYRFAFTRVPETNDKEKSVAEHLVQLHVRSGSHIYVYTGDEDPSSAE
jgi:acid phosphatase class B